MKDPSIKYLISRPESKGKYRQLRGDLMHIESLSLRNFRCFGDTSTKIHIQPGITGFVGDNGSGKTTALEALKRFFSPIPSERQLRKSDVHFGPGEDSQSVREREVVIDVVLGFSDLSAVPRVFNDIFFSADKQSINVRLLLEGNYVRSESDADDIDVKFYSVRTLETVPFGPDDERKESFHGRTTRFADLIYIPARREPSGVSRQALQRILKLIEQSADWDDDTREQSQKSAKELEKKLNNVDAIKAISQHLKSFWATLHDGHYHADPIISVVATEFEKLIRDLTLRFEKTPGGGQHHLEELSEGQSSLLYFALSVTYHKLIWLMKDANSSKLKGFKPLNFEPAPLTIFALEEPENHLAPFYLPRLINLLKMMIDKTGPVQSFVTSHSTSVLTRIEPENVRYFRNCRRTLVSSVKKISLPENEDDKRLLRQVFLANPEMYFAKLVIIGEGDSERIVIPRIANAMNMAMDPSFIAFVPIGGRHAKHLWKIVRDLEIPRMTLLDFDLGRIGGGMGRVKNAVNWLSEIGLQYNPDDVPDNDKINTQQAKDWIHNLRAIGIFYSYPLDLDMMMLQAYSGAYVPNHQYDSNAYAEMKEIVEKSVFGKNGKGNDELTLINESISDEELFKYHRLFKLRAKPLSHYRALAILERDTTTIQNNCPEPLQALIKKAKAFLTLPPPNTQEIEE